MEFLTSLLTIRGSSFWLKEFSKIIIKILGQNFQKFDMMEQITRFWSESWSKNGKFTATILDARCVGLKLP